MNNLQKEKVSLKAPSTDCFNIMSPKYFILLKYPKFQHHTVPLKNDYFDDFLKNIVVPFTKFHLIPLEQKLVDYPLQNQSLKFLEKSSFEPFSFRID